MENMEYLFEDIMFYREYSEKITIKHQEPDMKIRRNNLTAIKNLLYEINEADVWCACGNIIRKRKYLYDMLFGNKEKGIDGITSLFNANYHFKAYGSTIKGCPKHSLVISHNDKLKDFRGLTNEIE